MYPFSQLPPALKTNDFYVLLVLAQRPRHAYGLKSAILQASHGSIKISTGTISPLLMRLFDDGLIAIEGKAKVGSSIQERTIYTITEYGEICLQEEYKRLTHAIAIIEAVGLANKPIPTDIQRVILASQE